MSFERFNLSPGLLEALDFMGFKEPTPIQEQAIPIIIEGSDLIACAQTGTGKTGAFVLPVLDNISKDKDKGNSINTLVLAPTRELALQIDQQIEAFSYFLGISSLPVYGGGGGQSWDQQKKAMTGGADMIIATPGRLIAHMNMGYVNMKTVKHLILDEADRMLDMGFYDDIVKILSFLPEKRQNLMFSATMPHKIRKLAKTILKNPKEIKLAISKPAAGVLQVAYMAFDNQKIRLIEHLLTGKTAYQSIIIFASTKRIIREITSALKRKNFKAAAISSDLEQKDRENALLEFKSNKLQILVATDILARGIDIKGINLVINYDVPQDAEDYVHRIGRTARADAKGVAITLISDSDKDQRRFNNIERLIEAEIKKIMPPEHLGEGPSYEPNKRRGRGGGNRRSSGGGRNKSRNGGGGNRGGKNRGNWSKKKKSNSNGQSANRRDDSRKPKPSNNRDQKRD